MQMDCCSHSPVGSGPAFGPESPPTANFLKMEKVPGLQELMIQPTQREKQRYPKNWQQGGTLLQRMYTDNMQAEIILLYRSVREEALTDGDY